MNNKGELLDFWWVLFLVVLIFAISGPSMNQRMLQSEINEPSDLQFNRDEAIIKSEAQRDFYLENCIVNIYDCSDFITKDEMLNLFYSCGGPDRDIHFLDGDSDGIPCEIDF